MDAKLARLEEIAHLESMDGFWNDSANAAKVQQEKSLIKDITSSYLALEQLRDEFFILHEFFTQEGDVASGTEALTVYDKFIKHFKEMEQKVLLSDENDALNAIVSINAGAGGTESCDWAAMLYRMIIKWAEAKRFKLSLIDTQEGETAGIKSVSFMVEGPFAYGLLKSESGVHRLVRISPFDSNARRHTSFASIWVTPEIEDNIEIVIADKDLRIDVFRSGGAGGQGVNTTDSAVRFTHLPTGLVVVCQKERSQLKNKALALKILRSRLYELELAKRRAKSDAIEAEKEEIGWGAQIRSYVLHPYKLVKDHRNGHEVFTAEDVLDGNIDSFIDAYLRWMVEQKSQGSPA
ncbi:MAG: peptide chain release factor 2 [Bdellovibrionales bacterium GWA2_49_15]|nr:MAG: peptide chain release factor 2 [Bdellovibrionales bacterium GWA2_49_15]HAZ14050.1 peptide chain release factor 2 [Bdellovibrionales bacterium]